ncbi:MAG: hypothetical protein QOJ65_808 [Fimbriimonadaceae bacterium]|jgi:arabinosyltransferase C|nr:hypothetical protein [Fimbriimonadaceae bacterium]
MIADNAPAQALDPERRAASEQKFVRILAVLAGLLALVPTLANWRSTPPGSTYLGMQYNLDDHMVYAAWMRQAMDGRFLFDNRFTTEPQPGLTINLYFLVLGWVAKLVGIAAAMTLARVSFSVIFVFLLYRLVRRICPDVYTTKLAMSLAVFGAGIGFTVWHTFGVEFKRPVLPFIRELMLGKLPTDVWQPEGYGFPSMLTNGLFMVSLCLIVVALLAFVTARENSRWVALGAAAMFLLMNIHSYDVLLIAIAVAGLLVTAIVQKQLTGRWLARSLLIAAGALPPAAWFMYVLQHDPVFQARAATPTYAANFRQVVFGYVGLMVLGLIALVARPGSTKTQHFTRTAGALVAATLFVAMFIFAAGQPGDGYFMSAPVWIGAVLALCATLALVCNGNTAWNLAASWALLGTVAPYLPALFQRKLSMGLAVPWAILAALAVGAITRKLDRSTRNLILVLTIVVAGATAVRWWGREFGLASLNVSNTQLHPVYLGIDATAIVRRLNQIRTARTVVLAMPGRPSQDPDLPDLFRSPYPPDLNPILSGLTGVYTFAGHWSETPDYGMRRSMLDYFFRKTTSPEWRIAFLQSSKADYIVAPVPKSFPYLAIEDLSSMGEVVYRGDQFQLIRVR